MPALCTRNGLRKAACGQFAPCAAHPLAIRNFHLLSCSPSATLRSAASHTRVAASNNCSNHATSQGSRVDRLPSAASSPSSTGIQMPARILTNVAKILGTTAIAAALMLGPCETAEAARSGGRVSGGFHNGFNRQPSAVKSKFSAQRMRAAPGAASVTDSQSFRRARIPRRMNPLVALLALGGANIAGLWAVLALLRALADGSEPVTVVKLQVGLLTDPSKVQQHLSELCCMMKAGARGRWLILEEALLTLADDKAACAFADTTVVHSSSKAAAYTTFRRLAEAESGKADQEQQMLLGLPPADGQMTPQLWLQQLASKLPEPVTSRLGVPVVPATAAAAPSEAAAVQEAAVEEVAPAQQSIFQGLLDAIMPGEQAGGADKQAVVVTLVVAARGRLEVPAAGNWQQLRHAMQALGGLSSDRIMAIELLWTPHDGEGVLTKGEMLQDYPNLHALH